MVGGYILQITEKRKDVFELWVQGTGSEQYDELAILVESSPIMPKAGDSCWWQGRKAYCAKDTIILERVGYSYDPRAKKR